MSALAIRDDLAVRDTFDSVEVVRSTVENRAQKQQDGRCVRKACRRASTDGDYCDKHATMQRVYDRLHKRRKRAERAAAGLCPRCTSDNKPVPGFASCAACQILAGKAPQQVVQSVVENHRDRVAERKIEWTNSPTNRGRKNRIRGGKRGRRSLADDDRERILSIGKFLTKLDEGHVYAMSDAVKQLGRIQREEAVQAAMSWAMLIRRTCDEMLVANEYPTEIEVIDDDD